jgi:hypothetical protein
MRRSRLPSDTVTTTVNPARADQPDGFVDRRVDPHAPARLPEASTLHCSQYDWTPKIHRMPH